MRATPAMRVALLAAATAGPEQARVLAMLTGAAYGVVGLLGLGLVGTAGNLLALNHADNALHLATAAVATLAAWAATSRRIETA